jgi:hypothetical protein
MGGATSDLDDQFLVKLVPMDEPLSEIQLVLLKYTRVMQGVVVAQAVVD